MLGILPVECVLYRGAGEHLRQEMGVSLREVLSWAPVELEEVWQDLGLVIEHAAPAGVNFDDPAELDDVVNKARSGWSSDDIERIVGLVMKELPEVDDAEEAFP